MEQYNKEKKYIKWKYLYYIGKTEVKDSVYDQYENELREMGSSVVDIVDCPTYSILKEYDLLDELKIGERELRFHHNYPMLSLKKYQVSLDEDEISELYPIDIDNFFQKRPKQRVTSSPKFDGNSMELVYNYGVINQALTRGDEDGGLDRTEFIKEIVPNVLPDEYKKYRKIVIRGEVIIPTPIWEEKWSNSDKVDNPRNWLAGILNKDEVNSEAANDIDFIAYQINIYNDGGIERPIDQFGTLNSIGFPEVFTMESYSMDDFFNNVYPKFREYRGTSKYALDGIVLSFDSSEWDGLGENSHHPHWACAVKFVPNRVETVIEDIIWSLGKDGEYTPIATYTPIELDGTVVKRASLHNLGWLIEKKAYPGCRVLVAKKGEIIPQIIKVVGESEDSKEYEEYISKFVKDNAYAQ